eukprot:6213228-Pleurochrysis_carterae.AAC.2
MKRDDVDRKLHRATVAKHRNANTRRLMRVTLRIWRVRCMKGTEEASALARKNKRNKVIVRCAAQLEQNVGKPTSRRAWQRRGIRLLAHVGSQPKMSLCGRRVEGSNGVCKDNCDRKRGGLLPSPAERRRTQIELQGANQDGKRRRREM